MSDLSLLQDFICETTEHLEELEKNLLHLEANPGNRKILNDIFRSIHTIKGASEYLSMNRIADLSHKLENLLDMLRQGEKETDSMISMLLIDACDRLGRLISEIDETGSEKSDIEDLIIRLDVLESGKGDTKEGAGEKANDKAGNIVSTLPEYEEEHDKELFGIYFEQLQQNLIELVDFISSLAGSDQSADILNNCLEIADNLRSSSNYMGYEKLTHICDSWLGSIKALSDRIQKGTEPDIGYFIESDIKPGLDEILSVFPVLKSHIDTEGLQEKSDTLIHNPKNDSLKENDQNLFDEMINEMFTDGDTSDNPGLFVSASKKETMPAPCVYEEDDDKELFDIFLDQLNENTEALKNQAESVKTANDVPGLLDTCRDIVTSMKSSAGYMGYSELVDYYDQWLERLAGVREQLSFGHEIQAETFIESEIYSGIEGVLNFFPPHLRKSGAICKNILASRIDDHYDPGHESEAVSAQKEPLSENTGFIDKLSFAFDSKLSAYKSEGQDDPDIEEMEKELFSFSNTTDTSETTGKIQTPGSDKHDPSEEVESEKDTKPKDSPVPYENPFLSSEKAVSESQAGADLAEDIEKEPEKKERMAQKSVRVDAEKIDSLMNQVGELVVSRAWFSQLFNEIKSLQFDLIQNNNIHPREIKQIRNFSFKLSEATASLGRLANELQEGVMKVRMLPIERLFNRYPRLVRDLAQKNGKDVELVISGEETELDKMVIEKISDPLIHIIRNAVDHGIETPDQREEGGKPKKGKITLDAYHESNHVVIEITDNGKGIDPDLIRKSVLKKKLVSPEELSRMSEKEICRLILKPGFSTAGEVTHTSGRGVGMDVVKKNIEKLNGILDIYSIKGKETRFRIKIPLTLAIIPALLVKVGDELFTIPLSTVEETLKLNNHRISTIEGVEVIKMRNSTLPLVRLANLFHLNKKTEHPESSFVVVVNNGIKNVGLIVDKLIGQEEVVIKPLEDYLQEKSGFSGATILGDGRISLILDIYELVNMSVNRQKSRKEKTSVVQAKNP